MARSSAEPGQRLEGMIFSAKAFAGAMLALLVALAIGLPRPYWAMATAYIVVQPLAGALRSKALYRLCGTVLGAAATVVLVPPLVDAPELLALALALWIGACLYLALLDRTPRGYVFMLAGYSAGIIGFPAVAAPGAVFDDAVARVEEISLGILCATLVGSVVLPRAVGPVVSARVDAWLGDARRWSLDALAGRQDTRAAADRRRLAADAFELHMLSTHLAFDTSHLQGAVRWVRLLQQRMVMLLPVVASIGDRLSALGGPERLAPPLAAVIERLREWVQAGPGAPPGAAIALRAAIARVEAQGAVPAGWAGLLTQSLLARLRELVEVTQDCRDLRARIAEGREAPPGRRLAQRAGAGPALHRDHGLALLSGFGTVLAVLALAALWIATAWPEGAAACQMGAVACCFFAAQDDPVPAIVRFAWASVFALAIVAVYQFAILPAIDGFVLLVLALAPAFLVLGFFMADPATAPTATAVAVNTATLMGLQTSYSADFPAFVNSGLAAVCGMAGAAVITGVVRSVGAEWSARRLLRAGWADLAAVAAPGAPIERTRLAGRMIDRLGLLASRIGAMPAEAAAGADPLTDLRVGLNVADLRRYRSALAPAARKATDELLVALGRHFRDRAARAGAPPPAPALLDRLDRALAAADAAPRGRRSHAVLLGLVGIRRGLFPEAPPWHPPLRGAAASPMAAA